MFPTDENVIISLERADDAGVYRISNDLVSALKDGGVTDAAHIGDITDSKEERISVI